MYVIVCEYVIVTSKGITMIMCNCQLCHVNKIDVFMFSCFHVFLFSCFHHNNCKMPHHAWPVGDGGICIFPPYGVMLCDSGAPLGSGQRSTIKAAQTQTRFHCRVLRVGAVQHDQSGTNTDKLSP